MSSRRCRLHILVRITRCQGCAGIIGSKFNRRSRRHFLISRTPLFPVPHASTYPNLLLKYNNICVTKVNASGQSALKVILDLAYLSTRICRVHRQFQIFLCSIKCYVQFFPRRFVVTYPACLIFRCSASSLSLLRYLEEKSTRAYLL